MGDGLYLQTPSAPFHIVSISKDGQMNALGVNKPTLLVLSFPQSEKGKGAPGLCRVLPCSIAAG